MKLDYLALRVARHFMPEKLTRFMLLHNIIIHAGLETSDPETALSRYREILGARHDSLKGKRVLLFGYGGRFDLGVKLLEAGAGHVILCDKYAKPDDPHNAALLPKYEAYLTAGEDGPRPRPEWITLLEADIRDQHPSAEFPRADLVLSSSVYEHLEDVDGITRALAELTQPGGLHIHYVDLRDHYFKYPFEMLSYSERVWRGWLNPTSHHNRFRLWDYRRVFETCFKQVEIQVLERKPEAFEQARSRVRPEFISGDLGQDSVTLILVIASQPR